MNQAQAATPKPTLPTWWERARNTTVAMYHAYGKWLVSISWWRFWGYALLLLITMGIIHDLPPFTLTYTEVIPPKVQAQPKPPTPPTPPSLHKKLQNLGNDGLDISIDERGIRITARPATAPAGAASTPTSAASAEVLLDVPANATSQEVRQAIDEARREIKSAIEEAKQAAQDAANEAAETSQVHTRTHRYIDLMPLVSWFIILSIFIKITYKDKVQAETRAAEATEVAESESLKRQVVEARMAAMQAQVEPHFLFNTLASIDHLIETDPPRASLMQKNLIALLRAAMPTMREANAQSVRDLGRELAVIRPYLEILKVRMEERLHTEIRVSDGLLSAQFPPMMLQSLVENAIKHGLEPKEEGGTITVSAEIAHGKLAVTVADTGLGLPQGDASSTAGTGIGLSNIRERLALLYGNKASLSVVNATASGGVVATITVPYVVCSDSEPINIQI